VQEEEVLNPKIAKITVVRPLKKCENVTGKEKTKASSSPLKKKRPEIPPHLGENGNKVLFYLSKCHIPCIFVLENEHFQRTEKRSCS
jgi:hypothetical protein